MGSLLGVGGSALLRRSRQEADILSRNVAAGNPAIPIVSCPFRTMVTPLLES